MLSLRNKCRSQWLIGVVFVAALTTGCGSDRWGFPYKVGVQQGNWVTQSQVELLSAGMTPEQVRFALGTPTLTSVLHAKEEVDKSQAEAAQIKLDQERLTEPGGVLAIEKEIIFSTIIDTTPSTDPSALPDVPDQTPVQLN